MVHARKEEAEDQEFDCWYSAADAVLGDNDGRLSMDKSVHPRFACQLETRTWYITDDNGEVETVNGPGVVGKRSYLL